jgi:hypothetical protein
MITIVAHFPSPVVNFIFGGRNYGQNAKKKERHSPEGRRTNGSCVTATTRFFRLAGQWSGLQDGFVNFRFACHLTATHELEFFTRLNDCLCDFA